jgi:molybdopterin-guanine dinucleotide biosynthesis protein A
MEGAAHPIGAVLAGGAAKRLGGAKATRPLNGRPLIAYPLAAFAAAGIQAIVVAKRDSPLPDHLAAPVVIEPDEPRHPLAGVVAALEHAGGRAVVVCACDIPLVSAAVLRRLADAPGTAIAHDGERAQPLLARYAAADAERLSKALGAGRSATAAALSLEPQRVAVDPELTFNVNTPADLRRAEHLLSAGPPR